MNCRHATRRACIDDSEVAAHTDDRREPADPPHDDSRPLDRPVRLVVKAGADAEAIEDAISIEAARRLKRLPDPRMHVEPTLLGVPYPHHVVDQTHTFEPFEIEINTRIVSALPMPRELDLWLIIFETFTNYPADLNPDDDATVLPAVTWRVKRWPSADPAFDDATLLIEVSEAK